MKTTDYLLGFLDGLSKSGYAVFLDGKIVEAPKQDSSNKGLAATLVSGFAQGLAGGLVGALAGSPAVAMAASGGAYNQQRSTETLIDDLKRLQNHCDHLGIKDSFGTCILKLGISADNISDESIIGRLTIIHEQVHNFQKYARSSGPPVRDWVKKIPGMSGSKGSVKCNVFLAFSAHKRARGFFEGHINQCKHGGLFSTIHTYPYVVDLEDETIQFHTGKKEAILK